MTSSDAAIGERPIAVRVPLLAVANAADLVELNSESEGLASISDDASLADDDDETKQSSATTTILDPVDRKPIIVRLGSSVDDDGENSRMEEVEALPAWAIAQLSARPQADESACSVRVPDLVYPKSAYEGWEPPLPPSTELDVLAEFRVSEGSCRPSR